MPVEMEPNEVIAAKMEQDEAIPANMEHSKPANLKLDFTSSVLEMRSGDLDQCCDMVDEQEVKLSPGRQIK